MSDPEMSLSGHFSAGPFSAGPLRGYHIEFRACSHGRRSPAACRCFPRLPANAFPSARRHQPSNAGLQRVAGVAHRNHPSTKSHACSHYILRTRGYGASAMLQGAPRTGHRGRALHYNHQYPAADLRYSNGLVQSLPSGFMTAVDGPCGECDHWARHAERQRRFLSFQEMN